MLSITHTNPKILASLLKQGKIISFQTDTLFSLSADATNNQAIEKIYTIKNRDFNKPLPIFVSSIEIAEEIVILSPLAKKIANKFWPGALTIVLPIKNPSLLSNRIVASNNSIAIRIPRAPALLDTINILQRPLTATSANISNTQNIADAQEILSLSPYIDVVTFDSTYASPLSLIPSTIIKITDNKLDIIREGAISVENIYQHL